jgi:hypothetical protein
MRDKFFGIPRSIRMLETFYNPRPNNEWEDAKGEAALHKRAVKLQEAALIATVYDGSPEPKTYRESEQCKDFTDWWGDMCIEFNNMEQKKVGEIILKTKVPSTLSISKKRHWRLPCTILCKRIQSDAGKSLSRESCTSHFRHKSTSTNGYKDCTTIGSWTI